MSDYQLKEVKVDDLILDQENPRIPHSLHGGTEDKVIQYMIEHASITEIMESISENDYFPGEPIIVVPEGDKYIVIEGNRRSTALKLLHNPGLANKQKNKIQEISQRPNGKKPVEVPALIAKDRNEVQSYLGFRHITGVKNWKALEKGRYLNQLRQRIQEENPTIGINELAKELAISIGSRSDYVKRVIVAYELYEIIEENDHFNIDGLNDTTFYFANLVDSLNRPNLVKFLEVDLSKNDPLKVYREEGNTFDNLREWCEWLFKKNSENITRVQGKSDQLSMLASIVGSPDEALIEFRKGKSLEEAAFLTEHSDDVFNESIAKSIHFLKTAYGVAYSIEEFPNDLQSDLKEIVSICRNINVIKDGKDKDWFSLG